MKRKKGSFNQLVVIRKSFKAGQEDYDYGIKGGKEYLKYFLDTKENKASELNCVREFIFQSYENLECFLLPFPGILITFI